MRIFRQPYAFILIAKAFVLTPGLTDQGHLTVIGRLQNGESRGQITSECEALPRDKNGVDIDC